MKDKLSNLACGIAGLVNLGCIIGLTGIALKRNNDCYDAECKLINAECDLVKAEIDNICKDREIKELKAEINQLKGEVEGES